MLCPSKQRGFSLIELLIVIGIIAVLSAIGMIIFSGVQKSVRDAKRRADIKTISTALEQFYFENKRYPNHEIDTDLGTGVNIGYNQDDAGRTAWIALETLLSPYLANKKLPTDPVLGDTLNDQGYTYWDYKTPQVGAVVGEGYTVMAFPMESGTYQGCGDTWFDGIDVDGEGYPGKYICLTNQQ